MAATIGHETVTFSPSVGIAAPRRRAHSRRQLVVPSWSQASYDTPYAYGGKGHGIRRLEALGLTVPPALNLSSTLSRSFLETGELPKRLLPQLEQGLARLERRTGRRFGDPENPLLVSVRSGALISMPGMMETVCNVGLTPVVAAALSERFGDTFVEDCGRHLRDGLGKRYGFVKNDAMAQLYAAIEAVLQSVDSVRARAYRDHMGIEKLGTAITIQTMVFGNKPSALECGTGVVTSHDLETGSPGTFGGYLPNAQGPDFVSGTRTPQPITELFERRPDYQATLEHALGLLQSELGVPAELEFTIEDGVLYHLQFRQAKLSPVGLITHLVREKHAGRMSREEVVEAVPEEVANQVATGAMLAISSEKVTPWVLGRGTGITGGATVGQVAMSQERVRLCRLIEQPYILVREHTSPDDFPLMLGAAGIITREGGTTSHAAVVARSLGIPAVIGLDAEAFAALSKRTPWTITLDATSGVVWERELPLTQAKLSREVELLLRWRKTTSVAPSINPGRCQTSLSVNQALNDFYLAEAMSEEATDTAFKQKIRAVQARITRDIAEVFSTYLALAVSSEVTHCTGASLADAAKLKFMRLGDRFTLTHRNAWTNQATPTIASELGKASSAEILDFFKTAKEIFQADGWAGAIGGKKWADIAEVGELFWSGAINATVFIDRVFDLRHNTGRVFNKHPMVQCVSLHLERQLDCKREEGGVDQKATKLLLIHSQLDPELHCLLREGKEKGYWK